MARIRNLIYNGITVEQPIYNGIELTQWVHNGIVVWEKGDNPPIPIQATQVTPPSNIYWDSYMSYHNGRLYYSGIDTQSYQSGHMYSIPYDDISGTPHQEGSTYQVQAIRCYNDLAHSYISDDYRVFLPWNSNVRMLGKSIWSEPVEGDYYVAYTTTYDETTQTRVYSFWTYNKSDLTVLTTLPDIHSYGNNVVFISSTEFLVCSNRYSYSIFINNSLSQTITFSDENFRPQAFFNNYIVGISTYYYMDGNTRKTGYKICKVAYGSNVVEHILDATYIGYTIKIDDYLTWDYTVDGKDKDYVVFHGQKMDIPLPPNQVVFICDRNFNVYVTDILQGYFYNEAFQLIGKYLINIGNECMYELTFPS